MSLELTPESMSEIAQNLARARSPLAIFAGAGVVSGTGIQSDWHRLLQALAQEAPGNRIPVPEDGDDAYPEVGQRAYEAFESNGAVDRYYAIIRAHMEPTDAPYSTAQEYIWRTARHVITTNFEDSFEHAHIVLHDQAVGSVKALPDLSHDLSGNSSSLTYLHGRIDEKAIVFTTADFETFYPSVSGKAECSKELESFLARVYTRNTLVFVGVSFRDPYLRGCLKAIHEQLKRDDAQNMAFNRNYTCRLPRIRHYALLRQSGGRSDSPTVDAELEGAGIQVFRYEKHIDYLRIFELVWRARKRLDIRYEKSLPDTGTPQ